MARVRGESGSVTAAVMVFPLLLMMVMLVIQFALAYHSKAVLTAAAQDGTRAAQAAAGDVDAGTAEAAAVVADSAGSLIDNLDIDVALSTDGDIVTTSVAGRVVSLVPIPGLRLRVTGTASGPVEQFRPERAP